MVAYSRSVPLLLLLFFSCTFLCEVAYAGEEANDVIGLIKHVMEDLVRLTKHVQTRDDEMVKRIENMDVR